MKRQVFNQAALPFELDEGFGGRAKIGLIVLQSDQTIEQEFASLFTQDDIAVYHSRIPNAMEISEATLKQMALDMPKAAGLLPDALELDAIGYCCTSGTVMIGEARVDEILREKHPKAKTSNPLTACKAALNALGLKRIALVTPYVPSVTKEMQDQLIKEGVEVNAVASFNQSDDFTVARITPQSIKAAAIEIGADDACDGVFISCTNLRSFPILEAVEKTLGKPVLSSNQVLAWHLMRASNCRDKISGFGQLFQV